MAVWRMPLTSLRAPLMIDLKSDPYEEAWDNAANYGDFIGEAHLTSSCRPRPRSASTSPPTASFRRASASASFSIDQVIEKTPTDHQGASERLVTHSLLHHRARSM